MKSQYLNSLFTLSFSSDDQMTEKSYQSLHPSFGRSLPISLGRHLKIIGCDISFHQMICKVEKQQCSKNSKILQATILVYSTSTILHYHPSGTSWPPSGPCLVRCMASPITSRASRWIKNSASTILKLQPTVIQMIYTYMHICTFSVSDNFWLWWDTMRRS